MPQLLIYHGASGRNKGKLCPTVAQGTTLRFLRTYPYSAAALAGKGTANGIQMQYFALGQKQTSEFRIKHVADGKQHMNPLPTLKAIREPESEYPSKLRKKCGGAEGSQKLMFPAKL